MSDKIKCSMHEYQIIGRRAATTKDPQPKIYRMRIFAKNPVLARSRFWYFMSQIHKVKKANGELLSFNEINEVNPNTVKNFGIFVRYNSRNGTHNMHKEYRDLTRVGAVAQMYAEMSSRHQARYSNLQIIEVNTLKPSQTRRANIKQFHNSNIRFPIPHRVPRVALKKHRQHFVSRRPNTNA
eukprot:TRINITY_DN12480_c0_g1_i1.p1 TRINITY_DN12480_c0_g1~~TRINITY_DN12480_c0_g1_i1.p1  ORF type:complete len:182 (+),score=22.77 TRINITY_DN12480_c0_g1_i1:83-628(+)